MGISTAAAAELMCRSGWRRADRTPFTTVENRTPTGAHMSTLNATVLALNR